MKVKDLMTPHPVSVGPDETLWAVKRIFEKHQFHHVLVVEQGKVLGVLSDRDYLKTVSPHVASGAVTSRDLETMNRKVHQIMARDVISLGPDDQVMQAVILFNQHKISCLPILNKLNQPLGILSWRDVMVFLEQRVLAKQAK